VEKTRRLYDENAYVKTFTAKVTGFAQEGEKLLAALDATAFFPEGGGQFADNGTIGGANVTDAHERDGVIWHTVDAPLSVGDTVECGIDWARRFDFMQQHSGEHILSGLAHKKYGAANVGFHLGLDVTTIDFDVPIPMDGLLELEHMANGAVWEDIPIEVSYPSAEELKAIPYRSKKELTGQVRIVTVPGYDICACCGTHVARTGEIGSIKVLDSQNYKGGTRLWIACGGRALSDHDDCRARVNELSARLSVKPEGLTDAERRLEDELAAAKLKISEIQRELFDLRAQSMGAGDFILRFETGLSPDEARRYCLALAQRFGTAAVFSGSGNEWKYAIASLSGDVRALTKELNAECCGRGGGKPELTQGGCSCEKLKIDAFFKNKR